MAAGMYCMMPLSAGRVGRGVWCPVDARVDVFGWFGYHPSMILPPSWAVVLETLRPGFARRGTFAVFCVLATGMVAQTSRRSVVGMLSGARMAQTVSFHAACRFFSHAVWDVEKLGLLVARLVVDRLLGPDEAITVNRCWCPARRGRPGYRPTPPSTTSPRHPPVNGGVARSRAPNSANPRSSRPAPPGSE